MCRLVFAASSKPFRIGPPKKDGDFGPAKCDLPLPAVMREQEHVAMIVDWHDGKPGCSCDFIERSLPWEPIEEATETIAAFSFLRSLAEEHEEALTLFYADDVDIELEPNVQCRVAPRHLKAGMILFSIPFEGGEPPRILVKIDPTLSEPDKPETLGIL